MSSFLVSGAHIDLILWAAQHLVVRGRRPIRWEHNGLHDLNYLGPDVTGQMLVTANSAAVKAGLRNKALADSLDTSVYVYRPPLDRGWSVVEALKALHCYEYQACDAPDWETTEAHAFCRALEHALIASLPGYSEAPWGIGPGVRPAACLSAT